jgi:hypothetical protein
MATAPSPEMRFPVTLEFVWIATTIGECLPTPSHRCTTKHYSARKLAHVNRLIFRELDWCGE